MQNRVYKVRLRFLTLAGDSSEAILYISPESINIDSQTSVEIIGPCHDNEQLSDCGDLKGITLSWLAEG